MLLRVLNSLFPPKTSRPELLLSENSSSSIPSTNGINLKPIYTTLTTRTPILLKEYDTIAGNDEHHNIDDIPFSNITTNKSEPPPPPEKLNSLLWKLSIDDNSYMDPPPITLEYNYSLKMLSSKPKAQQVDDKKDNFNMLEIIKYSSAFGEAFGTILRSDIRRSSYALGTGFVCCDIFQQYKDDKNNVRKPIKFADELIRQMFSYVILPAFVVKNVALFTNRGIRSVAGCPSSCSKFKRVVYRNTRLILPILAGLISIPIIIHPIEQFVDYCMDHTYRAVLH